MSDERKVMNVELVGSAEAAEILGVEGPRVNRWRKSGVMPVPVAELRCGPIWLREDVEALAQHRAEKKEAS